MHSAFTFASLLLAASSAFASPIDRRTAIDKTVQVILQNQATELGATTTFFNVNQRRQKNPVGSTGPFQTIEIKVGPAARKDLRCQALGADGKPLIATRGENVDITFSDGGKGPWTFKAEAEVKSLVCNPDFKQATAADKEVRVILQSQSTETGSQTVFENFSDRAELPITGTSGPFETVEIVVGALIDPKLRCQVVGRDNEPLVATRGGNTDTNVSDADKGPWTFEQPSFAYKAICDLKFVAASQ